MIAEKPVHLRHHHIDEQQIHPAGRQHVERAPAVIGDQYLKPLFLELDRQRLHDLFVVVHHQNFLARQLAPPVFYPWRALPATISV